MKINSALELSVLKLCICPKGRHYRDKVNFPYYKPNSQTAIAQMSQQCSLWFLVHAQMLKCSNAQMLKCSNAQIVRS
jgi:hypothetical protein